MRGLRIGLLDKLWGKSTIQALLYRRVAISREPNILIKGKADLLNKVADKETWSGKPEKGKQTSG
jgi:hypothetical protein